MWPVVPYRCPELIGRVKINMRIILMADRIHQQEARLLAFGRLCARWIRCRDHRKRSRTVKVFCVRMQVDWKGRTKFFNCRCESSKALKINRKQGNFASGKIKLPRISIPGDRN
jgi:hypothetical protein